MKIPEKNLILVSHNELHPALSRELTARGLEIKSADDWTEIDADDRRRLLAGTIWFYGCLRHPVLAWRFRRFLRKYRIPLFAWNQDAPHYLNRALWRLDLLDRARLLDIYATHTLIDKHRQFADATLYLPNAADTDSYNLRGQSMAEFRQPDYFDLDVSFFGAMNGVRYKEMRARQEFFASLTDRLSGKGIRFEFREAAGMTTDMLVERIQRTKISLNFGASCEYGAAVASGLPERCYGIPAVGGFLLCDKRTHARDDFTPDENWAEFQGLDDCVEKLEYWLGKWDFARDLAERCHAHVLARHTYAHRAETLHNALLAWHHGQRGLLG